MKTRSAPQLLDQLTTKVHENIARADTLAALPPEALHLRPRPEAWNALESIEHLNRFNAGYLPRVRKAIEGGKPGGPSPSFTSSWIGNKFAAGMKPGPKTLKVKALKKMNPHRADLTPAVLETFLENSRELLQLIEAAREIDLTRAKIKTVLTSLISMRMGDVLRMMAYHDWRHTEQALRAVGQAEVDV